MARRPTKKILCPIGTAKYWPKAQKVSPPLGGPPENAQKGHKFSPSLRDRLNPLVELTGAFPQVVRGEQDLRVGSCLLNAVNSCSRQQEE